MPLVGAHQVNNIQLKSGTVPRVVGVVVGVPSNYYRNNRLTRHTSDDDMMPVSIFE
jgi:hypothetical protein